MKAKYPRTGHLPSSPGFTSDDVHSNCSALIGEHVIITEKMDGENTSLYADNSSHARSLDSRSHISRDWIKSYWAERHYLLPQNWRVCGENVYARHSIAYDHLASYFYGFSVWDEHNACLSWDATVETFAELNITPVTVLWAGKFELDIVDQLIKEVDLSKFEGLVVRKAGAFDYAEFSESVAKWVRKNHVQTDEHWMSKAIVPNKLR